MAVVYTDYIPAEVPEPHSTSAVDTTLNIKYNRLQTWNFGKYEAPHYCYYSLAHSGTGL